MAEPTQIVFSHKEVVTLLIKEQGIHEGIWGLFVKFGLKAMNAGGGPDDVLPTAMVPLMEIGIQRREQEDNISVDAAKVNPLPSKAAKGHSNGKSKTA
jgi:hypothetical protein